MPDTLQGSSCACVLHREANGTAAILATEMMLSRPACLVLLADATGHAGQVEDWFTEGFDTTDLQEAKALLEALGE
jgi:hypothetical protein